MGLVQSIEPVCQSLFANVPVPVSRVPVRAGQNNAVPVITAELSCIEKINDKLSIVSE